MSNTHIPKASTPRRQETPRRQDLHEDCIEDRLCQQIIDTAIDKLSRVANVHVHRTTILPRSQRREGGKREVFFR